MLLGLSLFYSAYTNASSGEARELAENLEIPGSAYLAFSKSQFLYEGYYGFANEKKELGVSEDTLFYLHSLTKPVLGTLTVVLVKAGVLSLDSPIATILPQMGNFCRERPDPRCRITIGQLLLHTSGFDYPSMLSGKGGTSKLYDSSFTFNPLASVPPGPGVNLKRVATDVFRAELNHPPGDAFTYGISYDLLGQVIVNATGKSLDDVLIEHLFAPLGMTDTHFNVPDEKKNRLVQLYNRKYATYPIPGKYRRYQEYAPEKVLITREDYPISGGGGLVGTARDYARFLQAVLTGFGGRLTPSEHALLVCNQLPESLGKAPLEQAFFDARHWGYSFGFGVLPSKNGKICSSHLFWSGYSNTQFSVNLETGKGQVFLTNLFPRDHNIAVALDSVR